MVRGYHVYQDVWSARVGEQLTCDQEPGNRHDTFAVAIKKMMLQWAMYQDVFLKFNPLKFSIIPFSTESCKKLDEQNFDELLTIHQFCQNFPLSKIYTTYMVYEI